MMKETEYNSKRNFFRFRKSEFV